MWSQYKINGNGLDGVLGTLERQIMPVVWELGEATVADVHKRIEPPNSYETVKTVMARMAEKGLLQRTRDKKAYIYRATLSQEGLENQVSRQMLDSLLTGFGSTAISQFADLLKEKPERLEELRALLNEMEAE